MTPVGAYLAQDDIIRIALEHGVDMIHPGYIFIFRASILILNTLQVMDS